MRRATGGSIAAARNGHANALRWLLERGYAHDDRTVIAAAESGDVECLRMLALHGADLGSGNGTACETAARHGHLAALRYLRAHGSPWPQM